MDDYESLTKHHWSNKHSRNGEWPGDAEMQFGTLQLIAMSLESIATLLDEIAAQAIPEKREAKRRYEKELKQREQWYDATKYIVMEWEKENMTPLPPHICRDRVRRKLWQCIPKNATPAEVREALAKFEFPPSIAGSGTKTNTQYQEWLASKAAKV